MPGIIIEKTKSRNYKNEFDEFRAEDAALILSLRADRKHLQSVATLQTQTITELQDLTVCDTVIYRDGASDTTRCVKYRDQCLDFESCQNAAGTGTVRIVTRDTISELRNSWAISRALVSGGYLHHSLETIPQNRPVTVQIEAVVRDSIVVRRVEVDRAVEVPRELTRWQTFRLNGFWVLLAVVTVFVGVKLAPIVRKIISG